MASTGSHQAFVNSAAWAALGGTVGVAMLAYLGQKAQTKLFARPVRPSRSGVERTKAWVLFVFAVCYGLLIPGFACTLWTYDISGLDGQIPFQAARETMVSFVNMLSEENAWLGVVCVVFFAMIVPPVKLCLLVLSEVWRRGSRRQVQRARWCVMVLQYISKWASPDMFAYVLLLYLIRGMDNRPLLCAVSNLEVGFTCFSIFCVGSTVAALGLEVPQLPEGNAAEEGKQEAAPRRHAVATPAVLALAVLGLCLAFGTLLATGTCIPMMSLRLDIDSLFLPTGKLDPALKPAVISLHLDELARNQVTLRGCLAKLTEWTGNGEANAFVAWLLFGVCVLATTVLSMLTLLTAALLMWRRAGQLADNEAPPASADALRVLMRVSKVLKKLSFLDVAVVGIAVTVLCGRAYRGQGIIFSVEWGLLLLFGAEVCHHVAYFLVTRAAGEVAPPVGGSVEAKLPSASTSAEEAVSAVSTCDLEAGAVQAGTSFAGCSSSDSDASTAMAGEEQGRNVSMEAASACVGGRIGDIVSRA